MQWTSQQQAAIDARGGDLLVAAAAGSGKTAVLVQRICSLAAEGVPIDSMLIVTFTNAAAAEMRQRITAAFEQAASEGSAFAAVQSLRIEQASISTLHRFCATVLRTHFQSAGIDPSFRIGDDAQTQVLRENAMQDAIDACFESEQADFAALCECFADEKLPELAFSVYRFMMSRPDPWDWLHESIERCEVDAESLGRSIWVRTLLDNAAATLHSAQALLDAEQALVSHPSGPAGYEPAVQSDMDVYARLLDALAEGYDAFAHALEAVRFSTLPRKSGAADALLADHFKQSRDAFKKTVKTLAESFAQPLFQAAEDIASMTDALRGLETLLRTFSALYTALKKQRNLLDYNDLEHLTLRALADEGVAASLRAKYALIFVDEYQDSNAIQETILGRIAHPGGLFFVGDVKQSIYGFRQADPSMFLSKYARFSAQAGAPERKIDLNRNFRSRPNILHCTNAVFAECMRAQTTDIEYDAQARLYPGLSYPDEDPATQVLLLCPPEEETPAEESDENTENPEIEEDLARIEQEALVCAREIRDLVGKQTCFDAKLNAPRPVRHRDIAILLRSMRVSGPMIVQILASQGIPAACDAGEGYFDIPEVRQALCLLQVIDNGQNDEALLAALHGESAQLSEEALAKIRIAYPLEAFSQACAAYAQEKDDAIALTLRSFYQKIDFFRLCARYEPLDTLLGRVINESGLLARAGVLPGGTARQANLRLLCARARAYQQTQNGSLGGFLAYAEKLRAGGDTQSARLLGENEDVVRVMTMHKSKGLEFPVVFLLALGQRFHFRAYANPLLMHASLGLGMMCYDTALRSIRSTLSHDAVRLQLQHEALCEEIRVLYVAMTRARDRLFLIGSVSGRRALEQLQRPLTDGALRGARTFLHLILPVLYPQAAPVPFDTPQPLQTGEARWLFTLVPPPRALAAAATDDTPLSALLQALESAPLPANDVSRRLSLRVPRQSFTQIKTSVTQLLREGERPAEQTQEPIRRLPQFMEQAALSAASRGTLFHTAMREMDLGTLSNAASLRQEILRQLDWLAARGLFTRAERQTLYADDFAAFFSSSLGARLLASPQIRREWPFTWRRRTQTGETLVQGVIDCCFVEEDAWILLDYKTDSGEPDAVAARYRDQILLYAQALTEITGLPVREKSLYLVRLGRVYVI